MQLTEGIDRGRGKVTGGLEEQKEWNCVFLFTGEEPITKNNSGGGVKNRVIEIETLDKVIENGNKTANFVRENYGFAGKEFIDLIKNEEDTLKLEFQRIQKEILDKNDVSEKQAMAMSVILLADKIVSQKILHIEPLKIEEVIGMLCKNSDVDISNRAYELIVDWINVNNSKFTNVSDYERWGELEGNICYIIPMVLKNFLKENRIDFNAIKENLFKKNKVLKDSQGKFTINKRINGTQGRRIAIVLLSDSEDSEDSENKELPF